MRGRRKTANSRQLVARLSSPSAGEGKMYKTMGVDWHLLKRKDTKGRAIYYLAVLSDVLGKNGKRKYSAVGSTGAGNIVLARKVAQTTLRDGRILARKETLRDFLITFWDEVGLYNPSAEKAPGIDVKSLDCFRIEVARELKLPTHYKGNPETIWISNLKGGKLPGSK